MNNNLVQQHICDDFGDDFNNEKTYSNSIIEYINHVIDNDGLMLNHIYIDDFLNEKKQAIVLNGVIDYFHDYYCLNIEGENDFNAGAIVNDISEKLKNSSLPPNPSSSIREKFRKNKHYINIKRSVLQESFIKNQPILPKVILNFNVNTLSFYVNKAQVELRQIFKSKGWNRRKIPQEEIDEKMNLLRSFKYTLLDNLDTINQNNISYIALNKQSFKKNDKIKVTNSSVSFLDNIESIVFFNNYTKKDFNSFQLNLNKCILFLLIQKKQKAQSGICYKKKKT